MNLDFLKRITGGLFLLTTEFNGIKNGCIINNCMEVSTNPSCISISVMKNSYTNELIEKSKKFAISILNKDVSSEMVKKFELFSGRKNDKFQNISTVMDKNNVPYVHGLPWCGTSGIFDTASYPLGGIILLRQSENDFIEELPAEEQILSVAQRFISPAWTPEQLNTLLSFSDELHDKIYIRRLHCTKKESAARLMQKEINIWEKGFYNEN